MVALTLCSLLMLSVVCAKDGSKTCYECHHTRTSGTPTDATLFELVNEALRGGDTSTCETIARGITARSICTTDICSKLDASYVLSVSSESVTLHTITRGCHSQNSGSRYTDYNTCECHDYDSSNPYATDELASSYSSAVLTGASVTGIECLCNSDFCNGAPVLGASVMGALLLALLSIFARN